MMESMLVSYYASSSLLLRQVFAGYAFSGAKYTWPGAAIQTITAPIHRFCDSEPFTTGEPVCSQVSLCCSTCSAGTYSWV